MATAVTTTGTEGFVERLYVDVLERDSDSYGLSYWVSMLDTTANAADVAKQFFNSEEFGLLNTTNSEFVEKLYTSFMDRDSDTAGLTYWVNALNNGMSRVQALDSFAQSTEFASIADSYGIKAYADTTKTSENLTAVESFVARFYEDVLGREFDSAGLTSWSTSLVTGEKSASDIANGFFFSEEFTNQHTTNGEFVEIAYETLLGRTPDTAGYNSWVTYLNNGNSRENLINGFVNSSEFGEVAGEYGISVNGEEITDTDNTAVDDDPVTIADLAGTYVLDHVIIDWRDPSKADNIINSDTLTGSQLIIDDAGNVTEYYVENGTTESVLMGLITGISDDGIAITVPSSLPYLSANYYFNYAFDGDDTLTIIEAHSTYTEYDQWIMA